MEVENTELNSSGNRMSETYFIFSQAQSIHLTHDSITLIFPTIKTKNLHPSTHISRVSPCQQGEAEQWQEAWHCVSHTEKIFSLLYSFTSYLWNTLVREGKWKGCLEEFYPAVSKQMEKERVRGRQQGNPSRLLDPWDSQHGSALVKIPCRLLKPKALPQHRARSRHETWPAADQAMPKVLKLSGLSHTRPTEQRESKM